MAQSVTHGLPLSGGETTNTSYDRALLLIPGQSGTAMFRRVALADLVTSTNLTSLRNMSWHGSHRRAQPFTSAKLLSVLKGETPSVFYFAFKVTCDEAYLIVAQAIHVSTSLSDGGQVQEEQHPGRREDAAEVPDGSQVLH